MLLCFTAAEWTAIFTLLLVIVTGALVLVTWNLWTSAQEQLREQRRTMALLSKPFLQVDRFRPDDIPSENKPTWGTVFMLKNVGDGSAWNVNVISRRSLNGTRIDGEHQYYERFIGKGMEFRVEVPFDKDKSELFTQSIELEIFITFSDLEKKDNKMCYMAKRTGATNSWSIVLSKDSLQ